MGWPGAVGGTVWRGKRGEVGVGLGPAGRPGFRGGLREDGRMRHVAGMGRFHADLA
jgi:hypothetical protein